MAKSELDDISLEEIQAATDEELLQIQVMLIAALKILEPEITKAKAVLNATTAEMATRQSASVQILQ